MEEREEGKSQGANPIVESRGANESQQVEAVAGHESVTQTNGAVSTGSAEAESTGRRRREWREEGDRSSARGDRESVRNR